MKLFSVFCWHRPGTVRRAVLHTTPTDDGVLLEEVAEPAGCGWFDSSWALRAGLQITEHETTDRVVNELPLAWWLAWQPAPQRAAVATSAAAR